MNSIMSCLKDFYWKTRQNTDEVKTFCSALTCKGKTLKKICDGDKVTLSLREKVMTCVAGTLADCRHLRVCVCACV